MSNPPSLSLTSFPIGDLLSSLTPKALNFSYAIHHFFSPSDLKIQITQQESLFSLILTLEENSHQLYIKSFKLKETGELEHLSIALYDAAVIEIVLRGLECILLIAKEKCLNQCQFVLNKRDASHLIAFDGLLKILPPSSQEETYMRLELSLCERSFIEALEKFGSIRLQIAQELWKEQREDKVVQQFLQDPTFQLKSLLYHPKSSECGQILAFPKSKKGKKG